MNKILFSFLLLFFYGCHHTQQFDGITSIQVLDRNGFSETISSKDRLHAYQNVDFLSSQPYEKVLRVYGKNTQGKNPSKLTSYHPNGGIWQYLEAIDGRAHGRYLEWHENGKVKIEAFVIEGLADLSEIAQASWLFDRDCLVWDEKGNLSAQFTYDKGYLIGEANYFYPNGTIQKIVPYINGLVSGTLRIFDEEGNLLEKIDYKKGKRDGTAIAYWTPKIVKSQESYREGFLIHGIYHDEAGTIEGEVVDGHGVRADFTNGKLYSLTGYKNGIPEGQVQIFHPNGNLMITYHIKEGKKNGEEWEFYPNEQGTPKILINWFDDKIQGIVKTWYPNGKLESEREMSGNKKQGICFAYYQSGDLMLMEEYDNDFLVKGSYYKKGETTPLSIVENGEGIATLYNSEGHFTRKVTYEKGKPVISE